LEDPEATIFMIRHQDLYPSLTCLFKQMTGYLLLDGEGKFILRHINNIYTLQQDRYTM
jgi:hypothetical protein